MVGMGGTVGSSVAGCALSFLLFLLMLTVDVPIVVGSSDGGMLVGVCGVWCGFGGGGG